MSKSKDYVDKIEEAIIEIKNIRKKKIKKRKKEYEEKPHVKKRRRKYRQQPHVKARLKKYFDQPDVKEKDTGQAA